MAHRSQRIDLMLAKSHGALMIVASMQRHASSRTMLLIHAHRDTDAVNSRASGAPYEAAEGGQAWSKTCSSHCLFAAPCRSSPSAANLSWRTSYCLSKHSMVRTAKKPCSSRAAQVRWTCSMHGLKEQKTLSGLKHCAADATAYNIIKQHDFAL